MPIRRVFCNVPGTLHRMPQNTGFKAVQLKNHDMKQIARGAFVTRMIPPPFPFMSRFRAYKDLEWPIRRVPCNVPGTLHGRARNAGFKAVQLKNHDMKRSAERPRRPFARMISMAIGEDGPGRVSRAVLSPSCQAQWKARIRHDACRCGQQPGSGAMEASCGIRRATHGRRQSSLACGQYSFHCAGHNGERV